MEEKLLNIAGDTAEFLEGIDRPILVISHYDCDGISSAVIANQMLSRAGKDFDQVFLDELTAEKLEKVLNENSHPVLLFTDIGSGQAETIDSVAGDREVAVVDHHEIQGEPGFEAHTNPHLVDIDGGEKISGAGMTYMVAKSMEEENFDLVPFALIGATGDIQTEEDRFLGFNRELLEEAVENDLVEVKKGLRLFGRSTKSLVKALKYTTDPFLKGISGSESGAVQFLRSVDIDLKEDGEWRSLSDLSLEEEKKIVHGLITRGYEGVEELLGDVLILDNGWEIQEFSSLMNACGRLERPMDGLKICLDGDFDLAWRIKRQYGRKISKYLSFVEDNKGNGDVVKNIGNGTVIDANNSIDPNMIGTITTICSSSGIVDGPLFVGMADKGDSHLKISVRKENGLEMELNRLMEELCEKCGGEGGGHKNAAGGKIPRSERQSFIKLIDETLKEQRKEG
ncbi:MAG: DHH family phosphoesterase [Candidatus Nanohaloarchaea archaeon]|nr:DHH family phosphoesterase [Candidatus Nanohaloarchaea archaeon]